MANEGVRLSHLSDIQLEDLTIERNLLKDQAAEPLRDYISSGRIPEGTRLTEREVSRLLGISRMPAHEALTTLEAEGLVVSRSGARHVIELTEKDVRDIHILRWTLERLAVELAAARTDPANRTALRERLRDLEDAVATRDPVICTKTDMALHQAIWRQSDNPHLLRMLDSVLGAIFVLIDRVRVYGGAVSGKMLAEHRELVELIAAGEGARAAQAMEAHLRNALRESLRRYRLPDRAAEDGP